jgi:hypothetical protein
MKFVLENFKSWWFYLKGGTLWAAIKAARNHTKEDNLIFITVLWD